MSPLLLLLALLAGATSLCFEILWTRSLTIEAGGPLASFAIVICAYMLGLSLGAALLGRAADRGGGPGRLFAALQCAAGGFVLLVALSIRSGGAVRPLLAWLGVAPGTWPFLAVALLAGGGVAFAPAVAMGGTLPLLAGWPRDGDASRHVGLLAAANAAGAAAGSLLCGFVLLPRFGLTRSLLIAAAGMAASGALAIVGAPRAVRPAVERKAPSGAGPGAAGGAAPSLGSILALLLATGFATTALEVVWTRLAVLSFGSSVQAGSLVLAAVIAGLSAGNALGSRAGSSAPASRLAALTLASGIAALATEPALGRLPWLAIRFGQWLVPSEGSSGDEAVAHAGQFVLLFAMVALPCLFLGAAFTVGCRAAIAARSGGAHAGASIGMASAATSAGNLVGAPAAYLGILGHIGSRGCLLAAAAVLAAAVALAPGGRPPRRGIRAAAVATILACLAFGRLLPWDAELLSSGPFLYGALYRTSPEAMDGGGLGRTLRERGELVFFEEGPDALVTVRRQAEGLLSMQVNGKTDASTGGDMKTQTMTAHLPLLLHSAEGGARRVLVIGLGSGVTAAAALAHPVERVDVVEISPEVASAARLFDEANRGALRDPRTRLQVGDARSRLFFGGGERAPELWDAIASQPSNPWISGQALLFTREFFQAARGRLAPGGVMSQWVQGYGLQPEDFRSVVATFADVFPHVSLWEESTSGGDYLLLGSDTPLRIDPRLLRQRLEATNVAESLARVETTGVAGFLSHYICGDEALRRFATNAPVQTEDRLSLEFAAGVALHRDTLGGILKALEPHRADPSSLAGGDTALAGALARRARAARKERQWAAGLGLLEEPGSAEGALLRAASYLRAGMRDHAAEILGDLTLRRPADRLPHLMLGYLLISSPGTGPADRLHRAAEEFRRAAEIDPSDARGRLFLSRALYAAGRLDDAIAENARAGALDPGLAEASSDRCALMLAAGDAPSAEAACREALSRDPDLAEAHANLGLVLARRGMVVEAERSYRRALSLDESLADARYNLAALCERQDRGREGLEVLRPLLTGTADAAALRLAARLALRARDAAAAREYLRQSEILEPGNEETAAIAALLR